MTQCENDSIAQFENGLMDHSGLVIAMYEAIPLHYQVDKKVGSRIVNVCNYGNIRTTATC